ncbi:MAG: class I SAM-dependent methyltransferase [Candidatus Altiarchaeota archaeon]
MMEKRITGREAKKEDDSSELGILEQSMRKIRLYGPTGRRILKIYETSSKDGETRVTYNVYGGNVSLNPERYPIYAQYARSPTQMAIRSCMVDAAVKYFKSKGATHLDCLDAGFGTGAVAESFIEVGKKLGASVTVIGVDNSEEMFRKARQTFSKNPAVKVFKDDILDLSELDAESIDIIACNATIHHLKGDKKLAALSRFRRVLKPGGLLLLGEYDVDAEPSIIYGPDGRPALEEQRRENIIRVCDGVYEEVKSGFGAETSMRMDITTDDAIDGVTEYPKSSRWWLEALKDDGFKKPEIVKTINGMVVIKAEK